MIIWRSISPNLVFHILLQIGFIFTSNSFKSNSWSVPLHKGYPTCILFR
jgi:hypothetical protein